MEALRAQLAKIPAASFALLARIVFFVRQVLANAAANQLRLEDISARMAKAVLRDGRKDVKKGGTTEKVRKYTSLLNFVVLFYNSLLVFLILNF